MNHQAIDYLPFRKNLYIQVRAITDMKDHEVVEFRRMNGDIKI